MPSTMQYRSNPKRSSSLKSSSGNKSASPPLSSTYVLKIGAQLLNKLLLSLSSSSSVANSKKSTSDAFKKSNGSLSFISCLSCIINIRIEGKMHYFDLLLVFTT